MRLFLPFALAVLLSAAAPAAAQIALGQTDDFQDGTTQGWGNGYPPGPSVTNQPGGPGGPSDRYLRVISDGGGSLGKLVVFNIAQWRGDYTAVGVQTISAAVNNLGATDLALRVWLEGPGGWFVSTTPVLVPAGSGWQQAVFPVTPDALTPAGGATDVEATLAAVTKLRIYHSPTPTAPPPPVVATLGLDDITAGPPRYDLTAMATSPLTVAPGGTVSFAYTITNNTGSPARGDLRFVASPGGARGLIRSGTLAGGQTVSGTYTQPIPAGAPPMTYTYCLQIGRFPGSVADEECFALVVTPALQAGAPGLWPVGEAAGWGADPEAGAVGMAAALPPSAALHAAAPNPFAGRAALGYDLPEAGPVRLAVYDLLGREVAVLVDAEQAAGRHEAVLDGRGLPDGTYLVVMTAAGGVTRTQRVTLIH